MIRVHFAYITGILLVVIIILLTIKVGDNSNIVNYVSFALTITSLFLSLISIVYAFYSNSSFSEIVGNLTSASNDINKSSDKLVFASESLENKIESIPVTIKSLENKFSTTEQYINELKNRSSYPDTQSEIPNKTQNISIKNDLNEANKGVIMNQIDSILNNNSLAGLFSIYIASLSYKYEKPFHINKIFDTVVLSREYILGQMVLLQSIKFVIIRWNIGEVDPADSQVIYSNETLSEKIEDALLGKIHSEPNEKQTVFVSIMGNIKWYFENRSQ